MKRLHDYAGKLFCLSAPKFGKTLRPIGPPSGPVDPCPQRLDLSHAQIMATDHVAARQPSATRGRKASHFQRHWKEVVQSVDRKAVCNVRARRQQTVNDKRDHNSCLEGRGYVPSMQSMQLRHGRRVLAPKGRRPNIVIRDMGWRQAQKRFFTGLSLKGKAVYQVVTFRCIACGYLDSYALSKQ